MTTKTEDKMSKEQKMNKRLHDAKMKEKFRLSFQAVNIGMAVVAVIAIANLFLLAKQAESAYFLLFQGWWDSCCWW